RECAAHCEMACTQDVEAIDLAGARSRNTITKRLLPDLQEKALARFGRQPLAVVDTADRHASRHDHGRGHDRSRQWAATGFLDAVVPQRALDLEQLLQPPGLGALATRRGLRTRLPPWAPGCGHGATDSALLRLLADARLLAAQRTQIVQLRATHTTLAHQLDR